MKGIAARLLSHVAFLGIVGIVGVALKEDVIACPSQLAVVNQSIYSYPIDIYQTMRVVPKDEKVDTCFAADLKFPSYHNCSYAPLLTLSSRPLTTRSPYPKTPYPLTATFWYRYLMKISLSL